MDRDYLEDMILGYESDLDYFKEQLDENSLTETAISLLIKLTIQTHENIESLKKLISYLDENE